MPSPLTTLYIATNSACRRPPSASDIRPDEGQYPSGVACGHQLSSGAHIGAQTTLDPQRSADTCKLFAIGHGAKWALEKMKDFPGTWDRRSITDIVLWSDSDDAITRLRQVLSAPNNHYSGLGADFARQWIQNIESSTTIKVHVKHQASSHSAMVWAKDAAVDAAG